MNIESHSQLPLQNLNEKTLVIYDVDETLIQPTDSYLINEHTPEGKIFLNSFVAQHPEVRDWGEFTSVILRDANRPLIEPRVIGFIEYIKSQNAKVIALTSMNTGKVGACPSLEKWRYSHLKSLGFEGSFEDLILKLPGFSRHPIFYKGVLAADLLNKGDVLEKFLEQVNYTPKRIIAIDDDESALCSLAEFCHKKGILFEGYLYKGCNSLPLEKEIAAFQASYLLENKKWINDEAAKSFMKLTNK